MNTAVRIIVRHSKTSIALMGITTPQLTSIGSISIAGGPGPQGPPSGYAYAPWAGPE